MRLSLKYIFSATILAVMLTSCQQPGGNSPGSEYMPDMGHSLAYEANHYNYYYNNTWGSQDEYYQFAKPRKPVAGTVPRVRSSESGGIAIPVQGSTPYYYADTEEERARAIAELIDNPYPITEAGLATGKELYNIFCATCHGEKANGGGYLYDTDLNPNAKYPVAAANFLLDEHINASNGRYYHAIMHGKNLMGSYKDKISTEERWQVIHYIRSLQAKEKKLAYNQLENTLNTVDRPAGAQKVLAEAVTPVVEDNSHVDEHKGGHEGDHNHDQGSH